MMLRCSHGFIDRGPIFAVFAMPLIPLGGGTRIPQRLSSARPRSHPRPPPCRDVTGRAVRGGRDSAAFSPPVTHPPRLVARSEDGGKEGYGGGMEADTSLFPPPPLPPTNGLGSTASRPLKACGWQEGGGWCGRRRRWVRASGEKAGGGPLSGAIYRHRRASSPVTGVIHAASGNGRAPQLRRSLPPPPTTPLPPEPASARQQRSQPGGQQGGRDHSSRNSLNVRRDVAAAAASAAATAAVAGTAAADATRWRRQPARAGAHDLGRGKNDVLTPHWCGNAASAARRGTVLGREGGGESSAAGGW